MFLFIAFFLLLCSSTITEATRGRVYLGSWSRVIRAHHHHGREVWQQADMVAELLRAHISKGKKQRAHWEWHRLLKPPSPPLVKLFPTRLPCCLLGPPQTALPTEYSTKPETSKGISPKPPQCSSRCPWTQVLRRWCTRLSI